MRTRLAIWTSWRWLQVVSCCGLALWMSTTLAAAADEAPAESGATAEHGDADHGHEDAEHAAEHGHEGDADGHGSGEHGDDGHAHDDHDHGEGEHGAAGHGEEGHGGHDDHGGVDYNSPPLQFELPLFLVSLGLFVLYVFVMRQVAWQPLITGLTARESRIANAEQSAHLARREAQQLRADAESRLAEVQEQVKSILAQSRQEAEAEKAEIVAQAEANATRMRDEAVADLEAARAKALEDVSGMVDEQVGAAVEQIVGRRLG